MPGVSAYEADNHGAEVASIKTVEYDKSLFSSLRFQLAIAPLIGRVRSTWRTLFHLLNRGASMFSDECNACGASGVTPPGLFR